MARAYYMRFVEGHHGSQFRTGGEPGVFPKALPWSAEEDEAYAFVAEFCSGGVHLALPQGDYLQLYQSIDESADQTPILLLGYRNEQQLQGRRVFSHPLVKRLDIEFDQLEDPDREPIPFDATLENASLFKSKFGGLDLWTDHERERQFLGQLNEEPGGFNFAGRSCCMYWDHGLGVPVAKLC
jgi:hypothetical protein